MNNLQSSGLEIFSLNDLAVSHALVNNVVTYTSKLNKSATMPCCCTSPALFFVSIVVDAMI